MDTKGETMDQGEGTNNFIIQEISRIKDDERELYTLDRERATQIAAMQSDITEIKTEQKVLKKDVAELKEDVTEVKQNINKLDKNVERLEESQQKMNSSITELTKSINSKKWQPKDYTVIIVAVLSLAGTIAVAILN